MRLSNNRSRFDRRTRRFDTPIHKHCRCKRRRNNRCWTNTPRLEACTRSVRRNRWSTNCRNIRSGSCTQRLAVYTANRRKNCQSSRSCNIAREPCTRAPWVYRKNPHKIRRCNRGCNSRRWSYRPNPRVRIFERVCTRHRYRTNPYNKVLPVSKRCRTSRNFPGSHCQTRRRSRPFASRTKRK